MVSRIFGDVMGIAAIVASSASCSVQANADVIYDTSPQASETYWISRSGSLVADDIHTTLPPVGGALGSYTVQVFGDTSEEFFNCPAEASLPFGVTLSLWSGLSPGVVPIAPIPGTTCTFTGLAKGSYLTLECPVNRLVPPSFWLVIKFDSDCAGWVEAGLGPPAVGNSDGLIVGSSSDAGVTWGPFFIDCGPSDQPCYWNMVSTMHTPDPTPWACCNTVDFSCTNIGAGECLSPDTVFTPGVLCNDLDPPCSEAGACCDIATGDCRASFEIDCTGFLQQFTPGASCTAVNCPVPENVPTVSQWGMIVLSLLLLCGLTVKFRRRSVMG